MSLRLRISGATAPSLGDLVHLSRWFLHVLPEHEITHLGTVAATAWADRPTEATPDRPAPMNAPLTAVITHHARPLLGRCHDTALHRIQQLRTHQGDATAPHPADMTMENWKKLSSRMRGRFVHAADAHLGQLDRVRLHSGSPAARMPVPSENERAGSPADPKPKTSGSREPRSAAVPVANAPTTRSHPMGSAQPPTKSSATNHSAGQPDESSASADENGQRLSTACPWTNELPPS